MFQSTPVIANGRIISSRVLSTRHFCFNPRPLLLTGESGARRRGRLERGVSIHARYC